MTHMSLHKVEQAHKALLGKVLSGDDTPPIWKQIYELQSEYRRRLVNLPSRAELKRRFGHTFDRCN